MLWVNTSARLVQLTNVAHVGLVAHRSAPGRFRVTAAPASPPQNIGIDTERIEAILGYSRSGPRRDGPGERRWGDMRANALWVIALTTLLVGCFGRAGAAAMRYSPADQSLPAGATQRWTFDSDSVGTLPDG